jgi:hypothetical protein
MFSTRPHTPMTLAFALRPALDRDAAAVERHALADQREIGVARPLAAPLQCQHLRLAPRTLADSEQCSHAERRHRRLVEHGDL